MSDMIDRLMAVSAGAGRDIASELSSHSTRRSIESRVRVGVKRRRTRMGVVGGMLAMVVATAAIAAPALLRGAPQTVDPGQQVVRTVGPLTVFDDGSISAVLANGAIVNLAADENAMSLDAPSSDALCVVDSPADLEAAPWVPALDESNSILRFYSTNVTNSDGERTTVLPADTVTVPPGTSHVKVGVGIQTDPALAPYIVTRVSTYRFAIAGPAGSPEYINATSSSYLDGAPDVTYSGDAALGTLTGTVEAPTGNPTHGAMCHKVGDGFQWEDAPGEEYVVAEVFLTDRQGAVIHLGTYTSWFSIEVSST